MKKREVTIPDILTVLIGGYTDDAYTKTINDTLLAILKEKIIMLNQLKEFY